ncbi:MAG TPA: hypothetical protein VG429_04520 [Casimicrobiaceae bacterium]|jgi:hypothetical protein|nr:hypothetical protein [Casimicrobiaceae bacterium]
MNRCLLMLAASMLLAIVGCATFKAATAEDYDRGDAQQTQFAKDAEVCAKLADADQRKFGVGGELDPTHATFNRMFDACMRASGYRRKPAP